MTSGGVIWQLWYVYLAKLRSIWRLQRILKRKKTNLEELGLINLEIVTAVLNGTGFSVKTNYRRFTDGQIHFSTRLLCGLIVNVKRGQSLPKRACGADANRHNEPYSPKGEEWRPCNPRWYNAVPTH